MAVTYFYRDTSSDLTGSPSEIGNFDLLRETGTLSSQINTGNMNSGATRSCWFFTEDGDPGTDGTSTGGFTLELRITIENADIGMRCYLQRYNSAGAAQGSLVEASEGSQTAGAAIRQYNWTNPDLGSWSAGDRLGVRVQFTNDGTAMNQSCRLGANLETDTLITPFTAAAPAPAEASGTVTAVGSVAAVGETPAVDVSASGTIAAVGSVAAVGHTTPVASGSTVAVGSLVAVGDAPTVGVAASGTVSVVGSLVAVGETPEGEVFDPPDLIVTVNGTTAELAWSASPTAGVADYQVFRRTPPSGVVFDPQVDTPVATGVTDTFYDDEGLAPGDFEYQIYGRIPA